jgi:hypothetical protein
MTAIHRLARILAAEVRRSAFSESLGSREE